MLLSAASKHLNIGQKDESQEMMRHKPPVPLKLFLPHPEKPFNIRYFYPKNGQATPPFSEQWPAAVDPKETLEPDLRMAAFHRTTVIQNIESTAPRTVLRKNLMVEFPFAFIHKIFHSFALSLSWNEFSYFMCVIAPIYVIHAFIKLA